MTKIKVTEDHIKRGKALSVCLCPIALAVSEQLNCGTVFIGFGLICFSNKKEKYFAAPESVREFTSRFDTGYPVEPFEFVLTEEELD